MRKVYLYLTRIGLPRGVSSGGFLIKNLHSILVRTVRDTYQTNLILRDLISKLLFAIRQINLPLGAILLPVLHRCAAHVTCIDKFDFNYETKELHCVVYICKIYMHQCCRSSVPRSSGL
jgi:hypothetical protein